MKKQKIKQSKLRQLRPQTVYTSDHPHMKGARESKDHLGAQRKQPHQPTPNPTWRELKGTEDHFRAQEGGHTNQRQAGQV